VALIGEGKSKPGSIYINGTLRARKEIWTEADQSWLSNTLKISRSDYLFHGCLAHFKIWERALTKEEIERIIKQENIEREGLCVEIVKDQGGSHVMNACTKESVKLGDGVVWVG